MERESISFPDFDKRTWKQMSGAEKQKAFNLYTEDDAEAYNKFLTEMQEKYE